MCHAAISIPRDSKQHLSACVCVGLSRQDSIARSTSYACSLRAGCSTSAPAHEDRSRRAQSSFPVRCLSVDVLVFMLMIVLGVGAQVAIQALAGRGGAGAEAFVAGVSGALELDRRVDNAIFAAQ